MRSELARHVRRGSLSVAHQSLIRAITELLRLRRIPCAQINQVPVETKRGWRHLGADKGTWDVVACLRSGVTLWIEGKTGTGRLSPEQIQFQREWEPRGARFVVISAIDELQEYLDSIGLTALGSPS